MVRRARHLRPYTGDEQRRSVDRADRAREADAREVTGMVAPNEGRKEEARSQMCAEQASEIAGWPMQAISRALQPNDQQRASLEMVRLRLAGMAQLVISSCPTYPLIGPMGRIAA